MLIVFLRYLLTHSLINSLRDLLLFYHKIDTLVFCKRSRLTTLWDQVLSLALTGGGLCLCTRFQFKFQTRLTLTTTHQDMSLLNHSSECVLMWLYWSISVLNISLTHKTHFLSSTYTTNCFKELFER